MQKHLIVLSFLVSVSLVSASSAENALLKQYKEAIKKYESNPQDYDLVLNLAQIAFNAGNFKQSYDLVWQLLQDKKDEVRALSLYSTVLIQYGYTDKAKRKLHKIIKLYPSSKEAIDAKKSLLILKRLESSFKKSYAVSLGLGLDSNPAISSEFIDISNQFTNIACQYEGDACSYNQRFPGINPNVSAQAEVHYIYDPGDLGGFFLKYGGEVSAKSYLNDIDAGDLNHRLIIEPGYATQNIGSFHLYLSPGTYYTQLSTELSRTTVFNQLKFSPNYKYRFEDGNVFTMGFLREEDESEKGFRFLGLDYPGYYSGKNTFYFSYKSLLKSGYYSLKLRGGDLNFDNYNLNTLPILSYGFKAIDFAYASKNTFASYRIKGSLENREFFYDLNTTTGFQSRIDDSLNLSLEVKPLKGFFSGSILAYKLYANLSNYTPMDLIKHEIVYTYYWKP